MSDRPTEAGAGNVTVFHAFDCTHNTSCKCVESALRAEVASLRTVLSRCQDVAPPTEHRKSSEILLDNLATELDAVECDAESRPWWSPVRWRLTVRAYRLRGRALRLSCATHSRRPPMTPVYRNGPGRPHAATLHLPRRGRGCRHTLPPLASWFFSHTCTGTVCYYSSCDGSNREAT